MSSFTNVLHIFDFNYNTQKRQQMNHINLNYINRFRKIDIAIYLLI